MEQYSNLNVHGKIKQKNGTNGVGEQGTESNDVVLYPTLTTRVPTPLPIAPTSAEAGKAIVVNSAGTGLEYGEAGMVDDVKIGNTSLVSNKIATIPAATTQSLGVVSLVQGTSDSTTAVPTETKMEQYVAAQIGALPEPMIFKGTVGTGGTISSLPAASSSNEGYVYKAISDGSSPVTYKIGDTLISTGSEWVVIPSGDEPSGTVTNIATGTGLTGGPITTTGTISLANTAVTAGSYGPTQTSATTLAYSGSFKVPKYTVDQQGRLTASGDIEFTLPSQYVSPIAATDVTLADM